jgi:hypothetical protein
MWTGLGTHNLLRQRLKFHEGAVWISIVEIGIDTYKDSGWLGCERGPSKPQKLFDPMVQTNQIPALCSIKPLRNASLLSDTSGFIDAIYIMLVSSNGRGFPLRTQCDWKGQPDDRL